MQTLLLVMALVAFLKPKSFIMVMHLSAAFIMVVDPSFTAIVKVMDPTFAAFIMVINQ